MSRRDEQGFALLLVLWLLPLLTVPTAMLTSAGRTSLQEAGTLRSAAQAQIAVDGAVEQAIFHLLAAGPQHWDKIGRHNVIVGGRDIDLSLADQSGKINPNTASAALLRALIITLGVPSGEATRLAEAIVDWRSEARLARQRGTQAALYRAAGLSYAPPGAPFESIDELADVLGMTPGLLRLLRPLLTLWWDGDPDPLLAEPQVRAALTAVPDSSALLGSNGSGAMVVEIVGRTDTQGGRASRRIVVQLLPFLEGRRWRLVESESLDNN